MIVTGDWNSCVQGVCMPQVQWIADLDMFELFFY